MTDTSTGPRWTPRPMTDDETARLLEKVREHDRRDDEEAAADCVVSIRAATHGERERRAAKAEALDSLDQNHLLRFANQLHWHEQGLWRIVNDDGYASVPMDRITAEADARSWPQPADLPYRAEPIPRPSLSSIVESERE